MSRKHYIWYGTVVAVLALLAAGCSSPTGNANNGGSGEGSTGYQMSVLPDKLAVSVPSSLSASPSGGAPGNVVGRAITGTASNNTPATSYTYQSVNGTTQSMKIMMGLAILMGMVADDAITISKITRAGSEPVNAQKSNVKISLTQAMVDAVTNVGLEITAPVGTPMPIETLKYYKGSSTTNDVANNVVVITVAEVEGQSPYEVLTYKWSDDKKKVLVDVYNDKFDYGYGMQSASDSYIAYDGNDGSGAFSFPSGTNTFKMTLKPDGGSGGAQLSVVSTSSDYTYNMFGYADNDGGIIYNTVSGSSYDGGYVEGFDASGNIIFQASKSGSDTDYTLSYGTAPAAAPYNTKAESASSLSAGATALLPE